LLHGWRSPSAWGSSRLRPLRHQSPSPDGYPARRHGSPGRPGFGWPTPARALAICNGMAYPRAQRPRRPGGEDRTIPWSARDYFLHNCAYNDRTYAEILNDMDARVPVKAGGAGARAWG